MAVTGRARKRLIGATTGQDKSRSLIITRVTIVILDTCGLGEDYVFRGTKARKLLSYSKLGSFDLEIPEAAFKEIEKHAREKVSFAIGKVKTGVADLVPLGLTLKSETLLGEGDAAADTIWKQVVTELDDAKVAIVPHPAISHEELLAGSIPERKPWAKNNKGYHDALIWKTVMDRAAVDDVVLITTNANDFSYGGEDPHPELHKDLIEDLANVGLGADRAKTC
jgi:hypothetical protein